MSLRSEPHPLLKLLAHLLAYGVGLTMLLPFAWMVSASLKNNEEVFTWPPTFIPQTWMWSNYARAWQVAEIGRYFHNSLIVAVAVTTFSVFFNALAGFAFAKFRFRGRDAIFLGILATMMLPGQVTLIVAYLIVSQLGYINTYQALIVPGLAGAFGIFYMRQAMMGVPNELIDAARVDGLTDFEIFCRIALPLLKPALAALSIFTFMGSWNGFFWPLVVIDDKTLYTLPLAVNSLASQQVVQSWPLVMAAATLIILPIICAFLLFQRQFVRGVAMTGLKD
jgi:multiple sugar transport system permease protein